MATMQISLPQLMINYSAEMPGQHGCCANPVARAKCCLLVPRKVLGISSVRSDWWVEVGVGDDVLEGRRGKNTTGRPSNGNRYCLVEAICEQPRDDERVIEWVGRVHVDVSARQGQQWPECSVEICAAAFS